MSKLNAKYKARWYRLTLMIIIFIGILVLFDCAFGFLNKKLFQKNYSKHIAPAKLVEAISYEPEILVLGTSCAEHHYVSDLIEKKINKKIFNLGVSDSYSTLHEDLLKIFLANKKIKLLVYDLTYRLTFIKEGNLYKNHMDLSILRGVVNGVDNSLFDYSKQEKYLSYLSFYKYSHIFSAEIRAITTSDLNSYKGYLPLFQELDPKTELAEAGFDLSTYDVTLFNSVKRIKSLCDRNNMDIIFVVSPHYYTKNNIIPKKFLEYVEKNNLNFVNYSLAKYKILNSTDNFKDVRHLNDKGARIFSDIFANDLKEMIENKVFKNF